MTSVVWYEFVGRRRAGMIHALDGGLWFHRHVWRGQRMAHLVSADRELLLLAGQALGLPARGLQYKPLKDPRTGLRVEAWHWDLRGPYLLKAADRVVSQPAAEGADPTSSTSNVDRRSKATDGMRISVVLLVTALTLLGCNEDGFFNDDELQGLSGRITASDTTLLAEEVVTVNVLVEYPFGSGAPGKFEWTVSDTFTAQIQVVFTNGTATVLAKAPGTTLLIVLLNERFQDTMTVDVVGPGTVKWSQSLPGGGGNTPALDTAGNAYVIDRGAGGATLRAFTLAGAPIFDVPSCSGTLSPGVSVTGVSYATGTDCTQRHDAAGGVVWNSALGGFDGGVAHAADGGAVILYSLGTPGGPGAVVVSRFTSLGGETWRDTLDPAPMAQKGAPAIAFGGDIYVPWRSATGSSLTRMLANGTIRWTVPLADWPRLSTPAPRDNRVYVAYAGGLIAFDSATGNVIWDRKFNAANPNAPADVAASSPVNDGTGNVYVQTMSGLHSYTPDGVSRWVADTLGFGGTAEGIGAPSLLLNGSLVVVCGGEVCAVRSNDGSLVWRSAIGGGASGTPAVTETGTILVTRLTPSALVALWGRALPILSSWSTEGGDMGRSRREQ